MTSSTRRKKTSLPHPDDSLGFKNVLSTEREWGKNSESNQRQKHIRTQTGKEQINIDCKTKAESSIYIVSIIDLTQQNKSKLIADSKCYSQTHNQVQQEKHITAMKELHWLPVRTLESPRLFWVSERPSLGTYSRPLSSYEPNYLHHGGSAFDLFIFVLVCLSVSSTTQKVIDGFFDYMFRRGRKRMKEQINMILEMIRITVGEKRLFTIEIISTF